MLAAVPWANEHVKYLDDIDGDVDCHRSSSRSAHSRACASQREYCCRHARPRGRTGNSALTCCGPRRRHEAICFQPLERPLLQARATNGKGSEQELQLLCSRLSGGLLHLRARSVAEWAQKKCARCVPMGAPPRTCLGERQADIVRRPVVLDHMVDEALHPALVRRKRLAQHGKVHRHRADSSTGQRAKRNAVRRHASRGDGTQRDILGACNSKAARVKHTAASRYRRLPFL